MIYNDIKDVIRQFEFEGTYNSADELHSGNVNATYHLSFLDPSENGAEHEYILQQINTYAFREPEKVMANIVRVTEHLRNVYLSEGLDTANRVLTCIPVRQGGYLYHDGKDRYWRAYRYIRNAKAYDRVERPEHFYETGRAFGMFQKMLGGFQPDALYETIPDFHNTQRRFYAFVAAVAADKAGRVRSLEKEIDFFFDRRKMMSELVRRIEAGTIPVRVTHNDTKINNVMIDDRTGEAVCVIDLDTVMAGSALYDYGDAIRFGANTAREDEPDLSKVRLDLGLFECFTKGFLSEVQAELWEEELQCMPLSVAVMTCELAMRFLTDYIEGDVYFRVNAPDHNLVRARSQMQLLLDVEGKLNQMEKIVHSIAGGVN